MSRFLDLDAAHAAVRETSEIPTVRLGGKDYRLPPEMPLLLPAHLLKGDLESAIRVLFGPELLVLFGPELLGVGEGAKLEDPEVIAELDRIGFLLSVDDLDRMANGLYGMTSGESSASGS